MDFRIIKSGIALMYILKKKKKKLFKNKVYEYY